MPKDRLIPLNLLRPRYTYSLLLSIEKLIYGGDGLARTQAAADGRSMAVFVPFVLPGEKIEAALRQEKPGFARGSITQVIEASPDRVDARCPYFGQCGGCHYQHIPYERQLEFKADILRETLRRIAKIELPSEIRTHASPPWNYRNRARLHVRIAPEFALGYFRFNSHEFLPIRECPISSPLLNRVIARLLELGGLNCPATVEEIELFADAADEHLLAWAFCGRAARQKDLLRWSEAVQSQLPEIRGMTFLSSRRASERRSTEQRLEDDAPSDAKSLAQFGASSIRYETKNHEYQVSAGAFFQVNRFLIDELISVVTGNTCGDVALDLYAGVGLFSVPLAEKFRHILGVEASHTSHADFVQNVPANVKAVVARTSDFLRRDYPKSDYQRNEYPNKRLVRQRPDLVVLDPPRTGAGKAVIASLVELGAPRVRYVSCDPATLARDIALLLAAGYRIEEAHLFDLFPETFHIESVMLLGR
ncbi:MAG TPA: 23S rRNA (uracil(1939)-C(5))-methyltransferase RlmD [Terriglobales bacterium]|nr:23S rRNA (uracil(1939)-C(5))-methyltransferase RlmD [Terriglobales bacterium]